MAQKYLQACKLHPILKFFVYFGNYIQNQKVFQSVVVNVFDHGLMNDYHIEKIIKPNNSNLIQHNHSKNNTEVIIKGNINLHGYFVCYKFSLKSIYQIFFTVRNIQSMAFFIEGHVQSFIEKQLQFRLLLEKSSKITIL